MGHLEPIRKIFSKIPVIIPLSGLVTGIILSWCFNGILIVMLFGAASLFALILKKSMVTIALLSAMIGAWTTAINTQKPTEYSLIGKSIKYEGYVEEIMRKDGTERMTIAIQTVLKNTSNKTLHRPFRIHLYGYGGNNIKEFDIIQFSTTLKPADSPRTLDFYSLGTRQLTNKAKGIFAYGNLYNDKYIVKGKHKSLGYFLYNIRLKLREILSKGYLSVNCENFIYAILIGDSHNLDNTTRENFSRIGLSHVLALSGTHIAIVHGFVLLMLFPLALFGKKNLSHIISLLVIWAYACLTGLSPSVTRAAIMISFVIISQLAERRRNSMNSLLFAALLILLFSPASLFSISFQLSFSAVFTIILLYDNITDFKGKKNRRSFLIDIMIISVLAMGGTALLSIYYFHTFPVYFLLANIPAAIVIPVQIIGGILHIIFSMCGVSTFLIDYVVNQAYDFMTMCADVISRLPGALIENIYINPLALLPYFFGLISLRFFIQHHTFSRGVCTAVFLLLTICIAFDNRDYKTPDGVYFSNDSRYTDLIIKTGNKIYGLTTKLDETPLMTEQRLNIKYQDFKGYNHAKQIKQIDNHNGETDSYSDNKLVRYQGEKSILIVNTRPELLHLNFDGHVNYLLIGRGYGKNNIDILLERVNVDTVILPHEINYLNEVRFIKRLQEKEIPYIRLREHDFMIPLN